MHVAPASRPPLPAQLKPLTGLRFAAALHVVFVHLLVIGHLDGLPAALKAFVERGYMAVPLFFVLSGFVLTYTYTGVRSRTGSNQDLNRRAFWVARFARIYPVYALSLLLAIPTYFTRASLSEPLATLGVAVPVLLMLQGWFPGIVQAWLSPAWSLSAEALFYLLFPFVVPLIARVRLPKLTFSLALLWFASVVAPLAYPLVFPNGEGEPGTVRWLWAMAVYFGPLPHLPEFLTGIVLGRIFLARSSRTTKAQPARVLAAVGATLGVVGYILAAYAGGDWLVPRLLTHTGAFLPIYAVLVYSLALGGGPIGRVLGTRPLLVLGEASYGLYLLHFPVFWWTERVIRRLPVADAIFASGWVFPLIELCMAVAASVVVNLAFERPARRLLRRVLTSRTSGAPAPEGPAGQSPVGVGALS
ncbi:MAG: acyltransferase family protein [Chloroflexota bacterium]